MKIKENQKVAGNTCYFFYIVWNFYNSKKESTKDVNTGIRKDVEHKVEEK